MPSCKISRISTPSHQPNFRNQIHMTNNVVLFIIIILTYFSMITNYASAQAQLGSSNSTSNSFQDERYSNLDPTMAIIMVVLVCSFFLMGFLSIYIRQCSEEAASAYPSSYATRIASLGTAPGDGYCYGRRQGLDRAVIDSFPVLAYISVKELKKGKASGELECAVCLSEFEEFDSLKLLPRCSHVFHPECIDAWLASHVTCPVCRANLEPKLEPDSCPRCGNVSNSNNSSSNDNVVTNSVLSESSLRQQQQREQPQVSISIVVDSEDRRDEEQEEEEERRRILGKLMRSHSTGHSLILQQVNMDTYALRLPEEGRVSIWDEKECMRRCSSYEVILDLGTSSSSSSGGKSGDFVGAPQPPSGGGSGQRFFTSVKVPFSSFGLKVDEQEQWRNRPPV